MYPFTGALHVRGAKNPNTFGTMDTVIDMVKGAPNQLYQKIFPSRYRSDCIFETGQGKIDPVG